MSATQKTVTLAGGIRVTYDATDTALPYRAVGGSRAAFHCAYVSQIIGHCSHYLHYYPTDAEMRALLDLSQPADAALDTQRKESCRMCGGRGTLAMPHRLTRAVCGGCHGTGFALLAADAALDTARLDTPTGDGN